MSALDRRSIVTLDLWRRLLSAPATLVLAQLARLALGQVDTEALLERALVGPAEGREGRRCEALTFAAVMAERSGRPERAVELYARALETGRNEYLESAYARLRLRALGQTP